MQKSVLVSDSFNCVVIYNSAIYVNGTNNTNFYVIENRLGGAIELTENKYLICDENVFVKDNKKHPVLSINNTQTNGDNITDVDTYSEKLQKYVDEKKPGLVLSAYKYKNLKFEGITLPDNNTNPPS